MLKLTDSIRLDEAEHEERQGGKDQEKGRTAGQRGEVERD